MTIFFFLIVPTKEFGKQANDKISFQCDVSSLQTIQFMMNFSAEELLDMVLIYGECRQNGAPPLRLYAERFPQRRQPTDSRVIVRAVTRLRNNERAVPVCTGGHRPRINVRTDENDLRSFCRKAWLQHLKGRAGV